ncbi:acetolactate decarboxylase [Marinicella sp. W31]|uniref:acetolactate decarboxylase n=1 Tax=Marinicella sp. W31 TaxID=3023713 RepID=UPI003757E38A
MLIRKSMLLGVLVLSGCCKSNMTRPDLYPNHEKTVKPTFTLYAAGDHAQSMSLQDFSGNISLPELSSHSPLYAIGPVAELQGEITIYDDHVSVSYIEDNQPMVHSDLLGEAAFLVYASVTDWEEYIIYQGLEDLDELEEYIEEAAENAGLDINQGFPFRIEAQVPMLDYHVIFKQHSEQSHAQARHSFALSDADVRIIGFWSAVDDGRYTHTDSRIHTHFQMRDDSTSGHIDAIEIPRGARLYLPIKIMDAADP